MSHVTHRIDDVLGGQVLSADDDAAFRAHLRSCEPCRARYDQALSVLRLARGHADALAPGELARLQTRAVRLARPVPESVSFPWRFAFAGAALAAALMLTFMLWPRSEVGRVLASGAGLAVDGVAVARDARLFAGARVTTDKEDAAVLLAEGADRHGLLLRPGTATRVWGDEVSLEAGRLRVEAREQAQPFVVRTESLRVVQATAGVFIVERKPGATLIAVHQGAVVVRGSGREVEVKEGQEAEFNASGLSPARPVAAGALIEDRGDGTVWGAIVRFLRQLLDAIAKALAGD